MILYITLLIFLLVLNWLAVALFRGVARFFQRKDRYELAHHHLYDKVISERILHNIAKRIFQPKTFIIGASLASCQLIILLVFW